MSLGSNLGDRQQNLCTALDHLEERRVCILQVSSLYETEPQEWVKQPWFLNAVAEVETELNAFQLLSQLQEVEREQGRYRQDGDIAKGPRIIDIDILLFGQAVIKGPGLTVPHAGMLNRRFVLEPLLEIAPLIIDLHTGKALETYRSSVQNQKVVKLTLSSWWQSRLLARD